MIFKVGDKVKVVRKASEWNGWVDCMDKYVGCILTILEYENDSYKLSTNDNSDNWWFPVFVLQPAKFIVESM